MEETVFRDRKRPLPLELTVELTQEIFNSTVTTSDSIVLFYATCKYALWKDAVFHVSTLKEDGFYVCFLCIIHCKMAEFSCLR